ncbi:MAG: tripartite tricarboxylate transporter TctB family protein [Paracoccaceae bacterium]|nr:MAG: tripartite tricarboxylate transporter TctB family protein [Paracoccaceae bacterium]
MRLTEALPALVMLGLSAVMVLGTWSLGVWERFTPGPAFFPLLIAIFATSCAVPLLIRALRGKGGEGVEWPAPAVLRTVGAAYLSLLMFLVLTPHLGMIPSIVLFLLAVMIGVLRQPVTGSLIAVTITTGFIYVIFVLWLALPLPRGPLGL